MIRFLLCLLLTIPHLASGGELVSAEKWSHFFPGTAFLVDPRADAAKLVRVEKSCAIRAGELIKLLNQYGYAANFGQKENAEKIYQKIYKILSHSPEEVCHLDLHRLYIVGSLSLLGEGWDYAKSSRTVELVSTPPNLYLILLAASLANSDRIQLAEFDASNGKVTGAYDCDAGVVYLNTKLRPLDLAATAVHELDHLMRDKFAPLLWSGSYSASENSSYSALDFDLAVQRFQRAFPERAEFVRKEIEEAVAARHDSVRPIRVQADVLLDEALATLQAAARQLDLRQSSDSRLIRNPHGLIGRNFGAKPQHSPYDISHDLTMVSPQGRLTKLWASLSLKRGDGTFDLIFSNILRTDDPQRFDKSIFRQTLTDYSSRFPTTQTDSIVDQMSNAMDEYTRVVLTPPSAGLQQIYKLIHSSYFSGEEWSPGFDSLLAPRVLPYSLSALLEKELAARRAVQDLSHLHDWDLPGLKVDSVKTRALTKLILEDLAQLESRFEQRSRRCEQFAESIERGELEKYLGAGQKLIRKPGGIRPGGIRPGGIRPGGIRPSKYLKLCKELKEPL